MRKQKNNVICARVPKKMVGRIEAVANAQGKTVSRFVTDFLQKELNYGTAAELVCDNCKLQIQELEDHFSNVFNIDRYFSNEKGKVEIDIRDSYTKELLCLDCAKNKGRLAELKRFSLRSAD